MSLPHAAENPNLVSKVSFFPVEDRTGENKALIVTIRKVVPEGDELKKIMEVPKRSLSVDSKRKIRSSRTSSEKSKSRSTMTETSEGISLSTQTQAEASVPNTSGIGKAYMDSSPCLKHAAQNISRKASHIPSEKISLCNNCSKSMLSYIFLVQDFLDSLAKEICGEADSKNCIQCLRQENRLSLSSQDEEVAAKAEKKSSKSRSKTGDSHKSVSSRQVSDLQSVKLPNSTKDIDRNVRKYEETAEKLIQRSISEHLQEHQKDHPEAPFHHKSSSNFDGQKMTSERKDYSNPSSRDPNDLIKPSFHHSEHHEHLGSNEQHGRPNHETISHQGQSVSSEQKVDHQASPHEDKHHEHVSSVSQGKQLPYQENHQQLNRPSEESGSFIKPMERQQPDFSETSFHQEHKGEEGAANQNGFTSADSVMSPLSGEVNNIRPTLTNVDRQVYDAARNGAGWESLSETQEGLISASSSHIASEAFVTMCRNNAEAMGCLVVGISLLLCRTSRTLCVVVGDGVSNAFRGPLSSVFHVVQCVRAMDSLGTTKLALLEQPELGISFDKLNVWRLTQFNKCVYLNPDTVVIQNCDELFGHEELSAVPDIGWPDCFNSGVFVFVPSIQTFWQLLEFAEKQGSYDGGDQGLLNSYFNNWSDDISKKLSFIYNLMANVSYTYTPAFRQFGRDVKIVQFHGSFKPWHVKFFSRNGQISPASTVHPTYVQFVFIWIKIFRFSALRKLSQEIQSYAQSQEVICAVELLRFFPLPTESEAEFFLTPPSVRLRLAERKLQRPTKLAEDAKRRKSAEFTPIPDEVFDTPELPTPTAEVSSTAEEIGDIPCTRTASSVSVNETASSVSDATVTEKPTAKSLLPGAEIGNYQGMKAWEQGRMDYQGTDSSDTIIKRLQFLMTQPK
ncbi:glycogenin-1 [Trichonephila clavata]|uniref:glycogenin glucosyltransferase n=1 Tax=Trichonephila clavata TaxID=2740835 RepID=A0A8X6FHR4_TRICU|nr:glycogenin-1 [Trichonephila clavata]